MVSARGSDKLFSNASQTPTFTEIKCKRFMLYYHYFFYIACTINNFMAKWNTETNRKQNVNLIKNLSSDSEIWKHVTTLNNMSCNCTVAYSKKPHNWPLAANACERAKRSRMPSCLPRASACFSSQSKKLSDLIRDRPLNAHVTQIHSRLNESGDFELQSSSLW